MSTELTPEQIAKREAKKKRRQKKVQEVKQGFKEAATTVSAILAKNPEFWKAAKSLVLKSNHPQWYGGDSNNFSGPVGPYIKPPKGRTILLSNTIFTADVRHMIDLSLVETQFNAAIIAFNKRLGFASNLILDDIVSYLESGLHYLAWFKTIKRILSYDNVPVVKDIKFGDKWDATSFMGVITEQIGPVWATTGTKGFKELNRPVISNYEWQSHYVDAALTVLALPQHDMFLSYIFDGVWSNGVDEGSNVFWEVVPGSATPWTNVKKDTVTSKFLINQLDDALQKFQDQRNENIYVETFLRSIGFTNVVDTAATYRDPVGQSLLVGLDATIKSALTNSFNTELLDNGLMIQYSADIDPTFLETFDYMSIGDIGRELKFRLMNTTPVATQALILYQGDSGEPEILWNKPTWDFGVGKFLRTIPKKIDNIDIASNQYITGPILLNVNAIMNAVPVSDFANLERFDFTHTTMKIAGEIQITSTYNSSKSTQLVGTDIQQVPDVKLAAEVVKINFTLGSNYLERLNKVVQEATIALTLR